MADASSLNQMDEALWERIRDLTGGAVGLCFQCGVCTAACPWGLVQEQPLSVRSILQRAQLGLIAGDGDVWLCTTCGQCEVLCPRGVKVSEVFRGLRRLAWEQPLVEKGLPSLLWSLYWNGNPWSQPPSQRSAWGRGIALPEFNPQQHEILLYVGCTASYDRRGQKIARAMASVLGAAGVRFGYLGDDEPCCGEAALDLGHFPFFNEIAAQTVHCFNEHGVTEVVTISPHCYDVFKNHYPPLSEGVYLKVWHYTQYLAHLLTLGRLEFGRVVLHDEKIGYGHSLRMASAEFEAMAGSDKTTIRVTYQDPCYLGRHNGEYRAPREILEAIPGIELIEMERCGAAALCCGGGGGRIWQETTSGARFADLRIKEAEHSGADLLATACPFCVTCLEDSLKAWKVSIQVLDIAEIAAIAGQGAA